MEHWWNDTDRGNWSTGRKTLYSVGGRWMNETGKSSPHSPIIFIEYPLYIMILPPPRSLNRVTSTFSHQRPCPIRATCPTNLILFDLITRIMVSGEQQESWSYWLCNFLQYHATSSLLGPNNFLTILFKDASFDNFEIYIFITHIRIKQPASALRIELNWAQIRNWGILKYINLQTSPLRFLYFNSWSLLLKFNFKKSMEAKVNSI